MFVNGMSIESRDGGRVRNCFSESVFPRHDIPARKCLHAAGRHLSRKLANVKKRTRKTRSRNDNKNGCDRVVAHDSILSSISSSSRWIMRWLSMSSRRSPVGASSARAATIFFSSFRFSRQKK